MHNAQMQTGEIGGVVLLSGQDLSLTYDGQRMLFDGVSVSLARGAKLALVGTNGAGKSSLMRILGGLEQPDGGNVDLDKNTRVAYVDQEPSLPSGATADEFLFSSSAPAVVALREYRAAAAAAEASDGEGASSDEVGERLGKASARMDATDGWAIEAEMRRLCQSLSVEHLLERDAASLSGGQRKRVALAAALLQEPELLLLDEPTNHLDIEAIEWLEAELSGKTDLTALIVTHDRAFLSAACEEVLELDRSELYRHRGDYEAFLEAKQARLESEGQQAQAARNKLRAELSWVQRQPKARSTKSKSRLDAYETLSKKVKRATSRIEATKGSLQLEATTQRLGSAIVRFVGASVEALNGATVLKDFSYDFNARDRIGVVGPNGVGKSTLLRALQGQLPLVGGEVATGETVRFGFYEQQGLDWPGETRVLALVREAVARSPDGGVSGERDERSATQLLSQFLFPPSRWGERIGQLSGGERRRLQLLCVLATQPNFLLLDEPTNDLDLNSIAVLEEFLQLSYSGVLVIVSHDRYFLDKVCEHHFVLSEDGSGEVLDWQGSFSEYLEYRDAKKAAMVAAATSSSGSKSATSANAGGDADDEQQQQQAKAKPALDSTSSTKPLSDFEVRQMEKLEGEIEALNEEKDALQGKISGFDQNRNGYTELNEWTQAVDDLGAKIEAVEEKWLALAERA